MKLILSICLLWLVYDCYQPNVHPIPFVQIHIKDEVKEQVEWLKARGWNARMPSEIRTIPREQIQQMVLKSKAAGACHDGVIFLGDQINYKTSILHASVLLHELVHIAQNGCAIPKDSVERTIFETQAYEMQKEWLREQGIEATFRGVQDNE